MPSTKSPSKRPTPGVKVSAFIEAARLVAEGNFHHCCNALVDGDHFRERRYLEATLMPKWATTSIGWYDSFLLENQDETPLYEPNNERMARTLGLLLCAELVREGFVPEGWTL